MNVKMVLQQGEDGYIVASCPSLKSCWSQGKTREEALENIKQAITLYLEPNATEISEDETRQVVELTL